MISVNDVFNDWTHGGSPVSGGTNGNWFVSGNTIQGTSNHVGSLVSDFTANSNFSFSVDSLARDNDTFGLMWGVQDLANHYRLSWARDYGENGSGSAGHGGGNVGFKILKEVGGSTSVLYSSSTQYIQHRYYNLSVSGTATGFDVSIKDLSNNSTIFDLSIGDTMFATGKVGIHELFQGASNEWKNFNFTNGDGFNAVPEPSAIAMWGLAGAIGIVIARRRKRTVVA